MMNKTFHYPIIEPITYRPNCLHASASLQIILDESMLDNWNLSVLSPIHIKGENLKHSVNKLFGC